MTLGTAEFIRRFLTHVLPKGFHRIRHYGLFASGARADNLSLMRTLLAMAAPVFEQTQGKQGRCAWAPVRLCPCCGSRMLIIESFEGRRPPRRPPPGCDQDRHIMRKRKRSAPAMRASLAAACQAGHGGACPFSAPGERSQLQSAGLHTPHRHQKIPTALSRLGIISPALCLPASATPVAAHKYP